MIADSIELVARGHMFDAVIALSRVRQDDPRHGDGARPPRRAGPDALRRLDPARPVPGPRRDDPGGVRGGRRARGGQDRRRRAARARGRAPRPAPAPAAASSPPTRWRWRSRCSASRPIGPSVVPAPGRDEGEVAYDGRRAGHGRARRGLRPSDIITRDALENAIAAVATSGGSTNGVLHLLAVAREAGVELDIDDFDRIAAATPLLCDLKPGGRFVATDLHDAGGVRASWPSACWRPACSHEDADHRHRPARSARTPRAADGDARPGGRPAARRSAQADRRPGDPARQPRARGLRRQALRPRAPPPQRPGARVRRRGGGDGRGHRAGRSSAGDVVVIRNEGPAGGPGMREMLGVTAALVGEGLGELRRAAHRRPLLRRHARLHGRPRRARGGRAAARSPRSARATRSRSTSRAGGSTSSCPRRRSPRRVAAYEPPRAAVRDGVLAKYAQAGVERRRGRRHRAGRPRRRRSALALAGDERGQQLVEARRALEHGQVPGVLEDDGAGVRADQPRELAASSTGTSMSLRPQTMSTGMSICGSRSRNGSRAAPRARGRGLVPGAHHELRGAAAPTAAPGSGRRLQRCPAQPGAPHGRQSSARPCDRARRARSGRRRPGAASRRTARRQPGGGDQHELLGPRRERDRQLGADEAAHRVAHHDRVLEPQLAAQRVDRPREALDGDLSRRHLRRPKPGRSGATTRCEPMNAGMLSSQFCQTPPRPWMNRSGGASPRAGVDHVDPRPSTISSRVSAGQSTSSSVESSPSA